MTAFEHNLALVQAVAQALGPLREQLVFVGGCAVGLLVTNVRAQPIRMTVDVDLVAEVTTLVEFHALEKQFVALGFSHDLAKDAPICRWRKAELVVDLMPSHEGVLGFYNRWYPLALVSAVRIQLPDLSHIQLIAAPAFIGTKIEAFKARGRGDFLSSHDLEDILTLVDGRDTLLAEINGAATELRQYLSATFSEWLLNQDFLQALPGHLPADSASQRRLGRLLNVLGAIARLATENA
jgi:predicted nucleotidyltransferase